MKNEEIVPRNARDMARSVATMLCNCSEVLFIDPHFRPDPLRYRTPLRLFLEGLVGNRPGRRLPSRIEVHSLDDYSQEHFQTECVRFLPRIIPQGMRVLFKRWRQNESRQRLHNRYILTDIGGVKFGTGLDENPDNPNGDMDEVSLMNRETYVLRWDQYASPNPAFEMAEPPMEIVGTAERDRCS